MATVTMGIGGGVVPDRRGELWAFRSAFRRAMPMAYAGEALRICLKLLAWVRGFGPKSPSNLG
jgi:hypothetical protein